MRVFSRGGALCAAILAFVLTAQTAFATVTVTADDRELFNAITLEDLFDQDTWGPTTTTPAAFVAPFNLVTGWTNRQLVSGAARGTSQAEQTSSLVGDAVLGTDSATITATGEAFVFGTTDSDAIFASAEAQSIFQIEFEIDVSYDYHLFGELDKATLGTNVRARLMEVGGATLQHTIDEGVYDWTGQLTPGIYRLEVYSKALRSIQDNASFNSTSTFTTTFELTPEPGSAVLLALAGWTLIGRRTRR